MSAASQAHPPQGAPGHGPRNTVIHLSARRRQEKATGPHGEPGAQQELTEHIEALYNKSGRTLSDKATAETFRITLGAVQMMLDGAQAEGVLDAEQHGKLTAMMDGIKRVPDLL